MKQIIPSYPNKYYKSKHERFKGNIICNCECDCDNIVNKKSVCNCCKYDDHQFPVYRHTKKIREKLKKIFLECIKCKQFFYNVKDLKFHRKFCKKC